MPLTPISIRYISRSSRDRKPNREIPSSRTLIWVYIFNSSPSRMPASNILAGIFQLIADSMAFENHFSFRKRIYSSFDKCNHVFPPKRRFLFSKANAHSIIAELFSFTQRLVAVFLACQIFSSYNIFRFKKVFSKEYKKPYADHKYSHPQLLSLPIFRCI